MEVRKTYKEVILSDLAAEDNLHLVSLQQGFFVLTDGAITD